MKGGEVMDNETSNWWYLVPLFFSILGGILAYVAIKDDDPDKASGCLIFGFIMFVVNLIAIFTFL